MDSIGIVIKTENVTLALTSVSYILDWKSSDALGRGSKDRERELIQRNEFSMLSIWAKAKTSKKQWE